MKPCAFVGQPLSRHIEGCLEELKKFTYKNPTYFEVVSRRLRSALKGVTTQIENRVTGQRVEEMVRLAVLFHDVGKAYNYFQNRFDERCSSKSPGFQYHEVVSAATCHKFFSTQPEEEWSSVEKALVVLSVLNHHHAFRNPIRIIHAGDEDIMNRGVHYIREGFCEGDLPSVFEKFNIRLNGLVLNSYDVQGFYSWLNGVRRMKGVDRWLKLYVLVMNPLIIADNMNAKERGGEDEARKAFIKEIEEAIYGA
ncbi:MAG: CRISPR-associated endonuclease Cas3'' [Candidatus Freyarchaeota archaeon]|nr:CRISPR-associated endonuclease Cas3'' [Candidatus Jordarchaeia archaeon]